MTESTEPAAPGGHSSVTVHRNDATHRFEAHIDGTLAGYVDFRQHGDEIKLIHTETLAGFEGRGIGTELARFALDEVRARGEKAVVLCPFIRSFLTRHPGYDDVILHRA